MILGTNFLSKTDIKLDYDQGKMLWYDCMLPMHPCKSLTSADFDHMEDSYFIQYEDELLGQDWLQLYATEILDAKYEWTDVQDVVDAQHHLTERQKCDLLDVLEHHQKLFDGSLGVYPHKKVQKLNLTQNPCTRDHIPCHAFIFPYINVNSIISVILESSFLNKRANGPVLLLLFPKRMEESGRWVSDFRELNKFINCNIYP